MAQKTLDLRGQITVGDGVSCPTDALSTKVQALNFACPGVFFPAVFGTETPVPIATVGLPGVTFVDLPATCDLDRIEFLFVFTSTLMKLRIGAAEAILVGSGASFPTGFAGGETLDVDFDTVNVVTTFTAAAQSAQDVANEINAAAALANLGFSPASVDTSGQVRLAGLLTGTQGSVVVNGGTAQAALGFTAPNDSAVGAGEDIDVQGTFLNEFGRGNPAAPARIQISGQGNVTVLAAGTTP